MSTHNPLGEDIVCLSTVPLQMHDPSTMRRDEPGVDMLTAHSTKVYGPLWSAQSHEPC